MLSWDHCMRFLVAAHRKAIHVPRDEDASSRLISIRVHRAARCPGRIRRKRLDVEDGAVCCNPFDDGGFDALFRACGACCRLKRFDGFQLVLCILIS